MSYDSIGYTTRSRPDLLGFNRLTDFIHVIVGFQPLILQCVLVPDLHVSVCYFLLISSIIMIILTSNCLVRLLF